MTTNDGRYFGVVTDADQAARVQDAMEAYVLEHAGEPGVPTEIDWELETVPEVAAA
jgi:hypothetical protein